jgi:hypothetical protein
MPYNDVGKRKTWISGSDPEIEDALLPYHFVDAHHANLSEIQRANARFDDFAIACDNHDEFLWLNVRRRSFHHASAVTA